mgnify:CR=1 FL=1
MPTTLHQKGESYQFFSAGPLSTTSQKLKIFDTLTPGLKKEKATPGCRTDATRAREPDFLNLLPHCFAEMLSTHRDIALVAADLDLRAFFDRVPLFIRAKIHGGLAATVANRLELDEIVGPSEQGSTAGKEVPLKVGP